MHLFYKKNTNGKISDLLIENGKSSIKVGEAKDINGDYPFFTSGEAILEWKEALVEGRNCFLNTGGNADVKFYVGGAAYSTDTWCISARDKIPRIKLVDCKNIDYLKQSGVYFLDWWLFLFTD